MRRSAAARCKRAEILGVHEMLPYVFLHQVWEAKFVPYQRGEMTDGLRLKGVLNSGEFASGRLTRCVQGRMLACLAMPS